MDDINIIGSLASIVGLVLTVWILCNTDRLKKAVKDTEERLVKIFGQEEMIVQISHTISKIQKSHAFLSNPGQEKLAEYMLEDAISEFRYNLERWRDTLPSEYYKELLASHYSLDGVRRKMATGKGQKRTSLEAILASITSLRVVEASLQKKKG